MKVIFCIDDYVIEPLAIGYLSACLKQVGHEVELIACPDKQWDNPLWWYEAFRERMPELHGVAPPTVLVCFSVTTGRHRRFALLNQIVHKVTSTAFTLAGGPHCTFFPEYAREGFSAICMGEGYDAIVEVADALERGGHWRSIEVIQNIATPRNCYSPILRSRIREPKDLDSIPVPDRGVLYNTDKRKANPIRSILASGCCGMGCHYCYSPKYRKLIGQKDGLQHVPKRDPWKVAEEAQQVKRMHGAELFFFQDDIFPLYDRAWLRDFCHAWHYVGVPFHIQTRAEFISYRRIAQLKAVGLHGVTFAIEAGDKERREMLGRPGTDAVYITAAKILQAYGVRLRIENMLGTPGETYQDCLKTLDLNIKAKPHIGWASLFHPYPGTKLGDEVFASLPDALPDASGAARQLAARQLMDNFREDFFHGAGQERRICRLQKLFALIVWKPALRPLVSLLVQLPFKFDWLYKRVKQYLYDHELYKL